MSRYFSPQNKCPILHYMESHTLRPREVFWNLQLIRGTQLPAVLQKGFRKWWPCPQKIHVPHSHRCSMRESIWKGSSRTKTKKNNMSTVYYQMILGLQDARLLLLRNVSECNLPASIQSKFSGRTLASKMDFIIYSNVENISGNSKRTIHTQTETTTYNSPKKNTKYNKMVFQTLFLRSHALVLKIQKIRSESQIRKLLLRWERHWPKIRLLDLGEVGSFDSISETIQTSGDFFSKEKQLSLSLKFVWSKCAFWNPCLPHGRCHPTKSFRDSQTSKALYHISESWDSPLFCRGGVRGPGNFGDEHLDQVIMLLSSAFPKGSQNLGHNCHVRKKLSTTVLLQSPQHLVLPDFHCWS